jgi:hypothetical protein
MSAQPTPHDPLNSSNDRRRLPRYYCGGLARISCLPLYESRLTARLRDLGLGGCCVECPETVPLLDLGVSTEIQVEVNSWSFRALAHVRAIRGRSGISMEFMRMSAGGSSMLADLIAELEESRIPPRSAKSQLAHSRQLVPLQGQNRHNSTAIVGTVMPSHSSKEISPSHRGIRLLHPPANLLDIFA